MTHDLAADVSSWQYEGPWSIYDGDGATLETDDTWAVLDETDRLVGFYCTGSEARVPGLEAERNLLDIGVGMRPQLIGTGNGRAFATAILAHCRIHSRASRARVVVQAWNVRSLRLAASMGFEVAGEHTCIQNGSAVTYAVLTAALEQESEARSAPRVPAVG